MLKSTVENVPNQLEKLIVDNRAMKKQLDEVRAIEEKADAQKLLMGVEEIGAVKFVAGKANAKDMDELRGMADFICDKLDTGVVMLASINDGKVSLVAKADKKAIGLGVHAGKIVKEASKMIGGGGGGRPDMAQAGGKNPDALPKAFETADKVIRLQLKLEG